MLLGDRGLGSVLDVHGITFPADLYTGSLIEFSKVTVMVAFHCVIHAVFLVELN